MRLKYFRNLYWDLFSNIIVKNWSNSGDFILIGSIIDKYSVSSILDFGAGWGRLLDLYNSKNLNKVVLQDISINMKNICIRKFPAEIYNYEYTLNSIFDINETFDLIVINNVLSAMPKNEINEVIIKILRTGKFIYIRENQLTDGVSWFNHDLGVFLNSEKILQKTSEYILYKSC